MTSRAGGRRSTRAAWSVPRRARRAPRGSGHRGELCKGRRGRHFFSGFHANWQERTMSMPEHVAIGHIFAELEGRFSFPFVRFRRRKGWGGSEKCVSLLRRSREPKE